MNYAIYNEANNKVLTYVTAPNGRLPEGYTFLPSDQVPSDAQVHQSPVPVPESVSRRQFRGALRRFGLFDAVDNLRNDPDLDEITRGDLVDFLDAATIIERNHAMILAFAPKLGVTSQQIDQVFILSDTL